MDHADPAAKRLHSLLDYVEQVIRLDERAAMRLTEHRLPTGQMFAIHQSEVSSLPGIYHDLSDDDGAIWLKIERLRRATPPSPPELLSEWLEVSPDPEREPILRSFVIRTVSEEEHELAVRGAAARAEDCDISTISSPTGAALWDMRLRLEDRPEVEIACREWIQAIWLPWALTERPVRKTLSLYQRFFEVAQLAEMGGGDKPFELVCGIGQARWRIGGSEIDLPLVERLVEIDLDEAEGAAIKVRPRKAPASVNLRAFESAGVRGVSLAYDSAKRAFAALDSDEGVSPFLRDSFEPVLRACQTQLDAEGTYLPDVQAQHADLPQQKATDRLVVDDRWVVFGRKRSDSFLLADIQNLKKSINNAAKDGSLPGPARTLVMGPEISPSSVTWRPLGDRVGAIGEEGEAAKPNDDLGDLFFPKPFNDDQIEIVRRLNGADGVVVQGPPGTGKTHTISNIICHAMATGKRVLVVSHGEPALAVLRDQLPEGIRNLAISITATEREGFKQLESAVRVLQSVIEHIRPSDQLRLIRDIESSVVRLRTRLSAVDQEIETFARDQMMPALNDKSPVDLARSVVDAKKRYSWFVDRPQSHLRSRPSENLLNELRAARQRVGDQIEYLNDDLPSTEDLPEPQVVGQWHDDLQRSKKFGESASQYPGVRVRIVRLEAVEQAMAAADSFSKLAALQLRMKKQPWLLKFAELQVQGQSNDPLLQIVADFANYAREIARQRHRYIASPVDLPKAFDAAGEDAVVLVNKLADGEKVFGLLAFRERSLRPLIDEVKLRGRPPIDRDQWRVVADFLLWRETVNVAITRWQALLDELGASAISSARELDALVSDLDSVLLELPRELRLLDDTLPSVMPERPTVASVWADPSSTQSLIQALRDAAASAKLALVRNELARVVPLFGASSGKLGTHARALLSDGVGRPEISRERVEMDWQKVRDHIDLLRQLAPDFRTIASTTEELERAGAPIWARRLRSETSTTADSDLALPPDWREAWDWAVQSEYLARINNTSRFRQLAEERVNLDADLRQTFERLVRERTFYSLGESMSGPVRSALMMFATALRKIGKGTSTSAGRHRRDAQLAMSQCYGAIPCWIMPTWRVAEQLPGEVGTFDLVIMDEASQSDIRELPALLRGKKILVVGDDKQVSPSAAFIENAKIDRLEHNHLREQPFKTLLLPGASLYDLAKVMFPDKLVMLREHFRCVEPIIRFSMEFYPEPLVPLRVPSASERIDPPLVDIYVPDGRRVGDKQNKREAEVIVQEIRRIVDDPTVARIETADRWRTIGVVSLIGSKQAALINRMILDDLGEDIVRQHHIACGDSATFQGNERDIIFLSMVADPNSKQAQTATQFEQRFNVAMSRARDRLVLVRSVREDELKPTDLKARIIRHFRDPMSGAVAPTGDIEALCESDFERQVLRNLAMRGYRVRPQVGALGYRIDLVVEGHGGRRLAIECDGDKYHGPERWADDMRRQRVLERVGWRFWRCWASSFILDPSGCMDELFETLRRHEIEPIGNDADPTQFTRHIVTEVSRPSGTGKANVDELGDISSPPEIQKTVDPNQPVGGVGVGDRVLVQYLDDGKRVAVTMTADSTDLVNGLLSVTAPLGAALVGRSEEDEIEAHLDGRVRRVLLVKVDRSVVAA